MLTLGEKIVKLMNINAQFELHEAPKGSVSRRRPDLAVLTGILGDRKRVDLDVGLEQTLNWYQLNKRLYRH
jgi:nucleoside-diphosphate-sugar epimerase